MLTRNETVELAGGRGRLAPDAAASIARVDAALGRLLDINSAWRDPVLQQQLRDAYERYLAGGPFAVIALRPEDSRHTYGDAIDTDDHPSADVVQLLNGHGWYQTVYRWIGGRLVLVEPWHFEHFADRDLHRGTPASTSSTPIERKEHDMQDGFYFVNAAQDRPFRWFSKGRGKSRKIDSPEWTALRALQRGANPKLPLEVHVVSDHWYDELVKLGEYSG
jgi:hypothetical protein